MDGGYDFNPMPFRIQWANTEYLKVKWHNCTRRYHGKRQITLLSHFCFSSSHTPSLSLSRPLCFYSSLSCNFWNKRITTKTSFAFCSLCTRVFLLCCQVSAHSMMLWESFISCLVCFGGTPAGTLSTFGTRNRANGPHPDATFHSRVRVAGRKTKEDFIIRRFQLQFSAWNSPVFCHTSL